MFKPLRRSTSATRGLLVLVLLICSSFLVYFLTTKRLLSLDRFCDNVVLGDVTEPLALPEDLPESQSRPTVPLHNDDIEFTRSVDDMTNVEVTTSIPINAAFVETDFDGMIFDLQRDGYVVVHQTWKDTCVLETKVDHMKSWEIVEKKLKIIFWTDETMDQWVEARFGGTYIQQGWDILKTVDKAHIKKADVFRAMLIWYYGGIYADLDIQLQSSLREFLEDRTTLVVWEPKDAMEKWTRYNPGDQRKTLMLSGFLLSGKRQSDFTAFLVNWIIHSHINHRSSPYQDVLYATGPAAEAEAYYFYTDRIEKHDRNLQVLSYRQFLPYAEHFSATTWLPGSVQGIDCVEIGTIYSNTTLLLGDPV